MKEPEKEHLQEEDEIRLLPAWKSALYILGGLAGLIIGGNFFVDGASGIARGSGCQRIHHRSHARSRRHFITRTRHLHRSRLEEKPRNSHRKRHRK